MKKTLAVRYCGGCREEYDRRALVKTIIEGLAAKGIEVSLDYDGLSHDAGIFVCGCPTECLFREESLSGGIHILGPGGRFNGSITSLETVVATLQNALAAEDDSR